MPCFGSQILPNFARRIQTKIKDLLQQMEEGLKTADPHDRSTYTGWTGEPGARAGVFRSWAVMCETWIWIFFFFKTGKVLYPLSEVLNCLHWWDALEFYSWKKIFLFIVDPEKFMWFKFREETQQLYVLYWGAGKSDVTNRKRKHNRKMPLMGRGIAVLSTLIWKQVSSKFTKQKYRHSEKR